MGLYDFVRNKHFPTPIKLEIGLVKVVPDRDRCGNDARYFEVKIHGSTVTQMVAEATNLKISKARDTYNCLIVHGSGMDMGFALQDRLYHKASQAGYPNMFDKDEYIYLGKRNKDGTYSK